MKSSDFNRLQLKEFPQIQDREASEARFWKAFSAAKDIQLKGSPNSIHFHPVDSSTYIITSSVKVTQFDSVTDKAQRSYSRFTDDAFSGRFRPDGKLLVAGEKTGVVKVFDTDSKSLLRQLRRHTAAVRCTRWFANGLQILSGSDDKRLMRWDLATQEMLWSSKSHHTDYVRAIDAHPTSSDVFASGGYDHIVTMWDSRQPSPIWTVNHGHPIEQCMFTPSGSVLITAGSNEIKLWDVISGGRQVHMFSNHQKNVSSLAIDGSSSRLLSGGLDGHVKVYSLQTLEVIHGMKFGSPILSIGLNGDNRKFLVGFVNGDVMVRNNKKPKSLDSSVVLKNESNATPYELFEQSLQQSRHHKGAGQVHSFPNTIVAETERYIHLQPFEKHLKKFNYQKALDSALSTGDPIVVVTVLEELCRRSGLTIALSGRDDVGLESLLSFVTRYIGNARYSGLVIQVAHKLLDIYGGVVGYSETIDVLFSKLQKQAEQELHFQKDIKRVVGALDCMINVSTMPKKKQRTIDEPNGASLDMTLQTPSDT